MKFSSCIFEKHSNIKFQKNQSSGSTVFHASRLTDVTMLTVTFCNFAKLPNNGEAENVGLFLFFKVEARREMVTEEQQVSAEVTYILST